MNTLKEKRALEKAQKAYEHKLNRFNEYIRQSPSKAEGYNNRGVFYAENEKHAQALNDLNKAIALNPNYATAYYNRGNVYKIQKNMI